MITLDLPSHVRLMNLNEQVDGKWEIYISPRPGHRWVVKGGPAPSIELALLEAMAMFDRVSKEVERPTSNAVITDLDLKSLGL